MGESTTAKADLKLAPPLLVLAVPLSPRAASKRSSSGAKNATVFPPTHEIHESAEIKLNGI